MKCRSITVAMMFFLASPASVLAEEQTVTTEAPAATNITAETAASGTEAATPANPATYRSMHKMGMMHKGQGHCGMMYGDGQPGKGMHAKHDQVVQRLDMIEARLAKIEAMLESLVRR